MKRFVLFYCLFFIISAVFAQPKHSQSNGSKNRQPIDTITSNSLQNAIDTGTNQHQASDKMFLSPDKPGLSDYMMSIERINDELNSVRDSAKLSFALVGISRRIKEISEDLSLIRQNMRGRNSVINIKNLYLYQSIASDMDRDNSRMQARLTKMFNRVYHARILLKTVRSDSLFSKLRLDSSVQITLNRRLVRLERKWSRTDSITKASIDSLNSLKVKVAENALSLSGMLYIMDLRLDEAVPNLFGREENYLWQKKITKQPGNSQFQQIQSLFDSEQKAIGYYFNQTSRERTMILILGLLLLIWLFFKRKPLKILRNQKDTYEYLHLKYLNAHPILSLIAIILCLMPFFDAYAPTSYIAFEYILLFIIISLIFVKVREYSFRYHWITLVILFITGIVTYLLIVPTLTARLWLLGLQAVSVIFVIRFLRNLNNEIPYSKWIRRAAITGTVLLVLGILCNLLGRFSLSGIFGISGIFAVVQAIVLPVFIDAVPEFILFQLQISRMKKGIETPFDYTVVVEKIKKPLVVIAILLWLIMLASNLNIYHHISNKLVELLTTTRTIGSISYRLISVLLFFVIIWLAHILQRLIGFLFGETGTETEDSPAVSKGQHSRLLITRLLVLIGGYLLAIAASGLPVDKLTIILGALGVGIGMGLQNVVNNFVSGIILIFDGSLQIGDEIEVSGQAGKVKEIGLRAITMSTSDGAEVIIPNGHILSQNIVNWTYINDQKRVLIWFSLAADELDANAINDIINNTIKNIPNVISQKKTVILYNRVGEGTCTITVRIWTTISNADNVKSDAMLQLSRAFAENNIGFS